MEDYFRDYLQDTAVPQQGQPPVQQGSVVWRTTGISPPLLWNIVYDATLRVIPPLSPRRLQGRLLCRRHFRVGREMRLSGSSDVRHHDYLMRFIIEL